MQGENRARREMGDSMDDITITRWKRYGHDRSYATAADETKLGWIGLRTGLVAIEDGADAVAVTAALEAWSVTQSATQIPPPEAVSVALEPDALVPVASESVAAASQPSRESEPTWTDLAFNEPGLLLQQQARRAWEAEKRGGTFLAYLARAINADTDERAWRRGIEGEQVVGAALDKAGKHGWKVLHSIPFGLESDIDHLAIGPGGVVLINTKHHHGAKVTVRQGGIYVNGSQTKHVLQVRAQAKRAAKALSVALGKPVDVRGCVAIHNGGLKEPEVKFAHHFKDVWVVTRWNIVRVLRKAEPVLTPEQVEAIYEVARRSSTWV